MKKIGLCVLTMIMFIVTMAQERQNKALPIISSQVLWSLEKATGWMKGADDNWLEGANKIQNINLGSLDSKLFDHGFYKLGQDNFSFIEIRNIKIEERNLLLIIKKFKTFGAEYLTSYDRDDSKLVIAYAVIDKNSGEFDKGFGWYAFSTFGNGVINYSEDYLQIIASRLGALMARYPWLSTSNGTTNNLFLRYKVSETNPDVSRFFISSSLDDRTTHFWLPYNSVISSRLVSPIKDYYFEVPTSKMTPIIELLIKK